MNVLLVNPKLTTVYNPFPYPPLGLMVLAANIRDKHKVLILDRNTDPDKKFESFRRTVKMFKPDIVGLTSLTGKGIIDALAISQIVKEEKIKVVWGGTHASMFPKQTLENASIDFVVIGEGEITFKEFLECVEKKNSLSKVNGLAYKQNGKIKINPSREFISNLDDFPMPAWDLVEVEKYIFSFQKAKRKIEIFTSRGCPYRCSFCYNLKFNKRRWRSRSASKIIEEIKFLKKNYQIDSVRFADDLFTVDKKRVKEFCELNSKVRISWDANCRINDINQEFLDLMISGGCHRLTFGIETGSQRMMNFLNKDLTVKQCQKAFELLRQTKLMTAVAFMIGLPTETKIDREKTLKLARTIKASHVHVYPYVPYPGSLLSEICLRQKWIRYPDKIEDWGDYSYVKTRNFPLEKEFRRIGLYFQFRNFYRSLIRGELGILKNFLGKKGLIMAREMISAW